MIKLLFNLLFIILKKLCTYLREKGETNNF